METTFYCDDCKTSYARKYLLSQHLKSIKHKKRTGHSSSLITCECGKSYAHKNSLEYHKKTCDFKPSEITTTPSAITNDRQTATEILLETMQQKLEVYEKERCFLINTHRPIVLLCKQPTIQLQIPTILRLRI